MIHLCMCSVVHMKLMIFSQLEFHSWNSVRWWSVHWTLSSSPSNFQVYHSLSQQRLLLSLLLPLLKELRRFDKFCECTMKCERELKSKHSKRFVCIGQCAVYSMFWQTMRNFCRNREVWIFNSSKQGVVKCKLFWRLCNSTLHYTVQSIIQLEALPNIKQKRLVVSPVIRWILLSQMKLKL